MGNLFAKPATVNDPPKPASSLRVQQSTQGKARTVGWGMTRITGNLIWYGDFASFAVQTPTGGGGGGGKGGGGSQPTTTSYVYTVAVAIALAEGPITAVRSIWNNKSKTLYSAIPPTGLDALMGWAAHGGAKTNMGLTLFTGSYAQTAWGYLTSLHPTEALNYRGDAYMAAGPLQLGDQPELPNFSFEVEFAIANAYTGTTDANPKDVLYDVLTNVHYGVGFPTSRIDANTTYSSYCLAAPLVFSPAITDQRALADHIKDWMVATNSEVVWSAGTLKVVPYGDTQITAGTPVSVAEVHVIPAAVAPAGPFITVNFAAQIISESGIVFTVGGTPLTKIDMNNPLFTFLLGLGFGYPPPNTGEYYELAPGTYVFATADIGQSVTISYTYATVASYTPPQNPLYSVGDDDYMPGSGDPGSPVLIQRKRIEDQNNSVQVEFLDASNDYNPSVVEAKDDAGIQLYGLKKKAVTQLHQFTQINVAIMSASLQLGREQILNTYEFNLPGSYILLEPMDIIAINDAGLDLIEQWVRIKEITENDDYSLTIIAEEYMGGTGHSPLYGAQASSGHKPNYNADPGAIATPVVFEPTDELAGGLFVWGGVTGADLSIWGGCEVWASWDDTNYAKLGTVITGPSRVGVTTATLATIPQPAQGEALDGIHTLSVNLAASHGQLTSGTASDNLKFGSLLWVGGELISYQNSAVTGTYTFDLTLLNRGAYGTAIAAHAAGTQVVRVDQGLFQIPFTQDKIGSTLFIKFLSFNIFGGAKQGLQDVGAFAYAIQGTALSSPLPDVQNFISSFVGDITYFDWDIVDDFRSPIEYEIRKGATWDGAQFVGTYAHPHVPAIGDATYWIKAVCQPIAGLIVYSENATTIGIAGSVIPSNLLASYIEDTAGQSWPGTLSGDVYNDGTFITTVAGTAVPTNTVALLHFNGPNNSTVMTESVNAHVFTPAGNAKLDTTQFKFGPTSLKLDGTGDFLTGDGHADFAFGAGDFQIDLWFRANTINIGHSLYDSRPAATAGAYVTIYVDSDNSVRFFANSADRITGAAGAIALGNFYHVALTKVGGNTRLFLNGVQQGSTFVDAITYLNGASRPAIGAFGDNTAFGNADGWIDELRVIKGSALWSAAFTPPAAASSSGVGYYTMKATDTIDNQRLAPCLVQAIFAAAGGGTSDFFNPGPPDNNDVFAHTDIFDSAANQFILVSPEIDISTDGTNFLGWKKYAAGFYNLWKVTARVRIASLDPENVQTSLTAFEFIVYAQNRIDHPLVNAAVAAGGTTVTFQPDGLGANRTFNGGPNGGTTSPSAGVTKPAASLPGTQVTITNVTAGDDIFISGLSLSQVTIQIKNGGVGVGRNVTLQVWGF